MKYTEFSVKYKYLNCNLTLSFKNLLADVYYHCYFKVTAYILSYIAVVVATIIICTTNTIPELSN